MKVRFYKMESDLVKYNGDIIGIRYLKVDCYSEEYESVWLCQTEVENPFKLSIVNIDDAEYVAGNTQMIEDNGELIVCIEDWIRKDR